MILLTFVGVIETLSTAYTKKQGQISVEEMLITTDPNYSSSVEEVLAEIATCSVTTVSAKIEKPQALPSNIRQNKHYHSQAPITGYHERSDNCTRTLEIAPNYVLRRPQFVVASQDFPATRVTGRATSRSSPAIARVFSKDSPKLAP